MDVHKQFEALRRTTSALDRQYICYHTAAGRKITVDGKLLRAPNPDPLVEKALTGPVSLARIILKHEFYTERSLSTARRFAEHFHDRFADPFWCFRSDEIRSVVADFEGYGQ